MFFKNNGSDAISYKGFFEEEDLIRMIKKFVGIEVAFVIGLVGLTYLLSDNNNIVDYIHYKYNNSVYNIFYDQTYDNLVNVNDPLENIKSNDGWENVDDVIELLNKSSYLSQSDKEFLGNRNYFNLIVPYYIGTPMENEMKIRLSDIAIRYFDESDEYYGTNTVGYWSPLNSNVINVSKDYKINESSSKYLYESRNAITSHEFVHLSQADSFNYISESMAELISEEFYDCYFYSVYEEGVKTLKLLIDIIGPDPILKMVYGGDSSLFNDILCDNLSYGDYHKLINFFKKNPDEVIFQEPEIRGILCNLYQNINGKDIKTDENILYNIFYENSEDMGIILLHHELSSKRIYLNKEKMEEKEKYVINISDYMVGNPVNDLIGSEHVWGIKKSLTPNEFLKSLEDGKYHSYSYEFPDYITMDEKNDGFICDFSKTDYNIGQGLESGKATLWISVLDAVNNGYVTAFETNVISMGSEPPAGWQYDTDEYGDKEVKTKYYSKISNGIISNDGDELHIEIPSIKERFKFGSNVDTKSKTN